ncbi:SH3 domain-containing protein C23A1.17 [Schizosaccharomyces pombe]
MSSFPTRVVALYPYRSSFSDDLEFDPGQVIDVVSNLDGDWYTGTYVDSDGNRKIGSFPKDFTEPAEDAVFVERASEMALHQPTPTSAVHSRNSSLGYAPSITRSIKSISNNTEHLGADTESYLSANDFIDSTSEALTKIVDVDTLSAPFGNDSNSRPHSLKNVEKLHTFSAPYTISEETPSCSTENDSLPLTATHTITGGEDAATGAAVTNTTTTHITTSTNTSTVIPSNPNSVFLVDCTHSQCPTDLPNIATTQHSLRYLDNASASAITVLERTHPAASSTMATESSHQSPSADSQAEELSKSQRVAKDDDPFVVSNTANSDEPASSSKPAKPLTDLNRAFSQRLNLDPQKPGKSQGEISEQEEDEYDDAESDEMHSPYSTHEPESEPEDQDEPSEKDDENKDVEEEQEQEQEEEQIDPEEAKRIALRERMAKMSGGIGMHVFGLPGLAAPIGRKNTLRRTPAKSSEEAKSTTNDSSPPKDSSSTSTQPTEQSNAQQAPSPKEEERPLPSEPSQNQPAEYRDTPDTPRNIMPLPGLMSADQPIKVTEPSNDADKAIVAEGPNNEEETKGPVIPETQETSEQQVHKTPSPEKQKVLSPPPIITNFDKETLASNEAHEAVPQKPSAPQVTRLMAPQDSSSVVTPSPTSLLDPARAVRKVIDGIDPPKEAGAGATADVESAANSPITPPRTWHSPDFTSKSFEPIERKLPSRISEVTEDSIDEDKQNEVDPSTSARALPPPGLRFGKVDTLASLAHDDLDDLPAVPRIFSPPPLPKTPSGEFGDNEFMFPKKSNRVRGHQSRPSTGSQLRNVVPVSIVTSGGRPALPDEMASPSSSIGHPLPSPPPADFNSLNVDFYEPHSYLESPAPEPQPSYEEESFNATVIHAPTPSTATFQGHPTISNVATPPLKQDVTESKASPVADASATHQSSTGLTQEITQLGSNMRLPTKLTRPSNDGRKASGPRPAAPPSIPPPLPVSNILSSPTSEPPKDHPPSAPLSKPVSTSPAAPLARVPPVPKLSSKAPPVPLPSADAPPIPVPSTAPPVPIPTSTPPVPKSSSGAPSAPPPVPAPSSEIPSIPAPSGAPPVPAPSGIPPVPKPSVAAPPVPKPSVAVPPVPAPSGAPPVPKPSVAAPPVPVPSGAPPVPKPSVAAPPVPAPSGAPPVPKPSVAAPPVPAPSSGIPPVPKPSVGVPPVPPPSTAPPVPTPSAGLPPVPVPTAKAPPVPAPSSEAPSVSTPRSSVPSPHSNASPSPTSSSMASAAPARTSVSRSKSKAERHETSTSSRKSSKSGEHHHHHNEGHADSSSTRTSLAHQDSRKSLHRHLSRSSSRASKKPSIVSTTGPFNESFSAKPVEPCASEKWWLNSTAVPKSVVQMNDSVLYMIKEGITGQDKKYKSVHILFPDYSQTVLTATFNPHNQNITQLSQLQLAPPAQPSKARLDEEYACYGSTILKKARAYQGSMVGDGSAFTFVNSVMSILAHNLEPINKQTFGGVIYKNVGNVTVQQIGEIRPGDIVTFDKAKFSGQKGTLRSKYSLEVGKPMHYGIISEWDVSKLKIRVLEQGRESKKVSVASYKFGDLKSGEVTVWRVMRRSWLGWN